MSAVDAPTLFQEPVEHFWSAKAPAQLTFSESALGAQRHRGWAEAPISSWVGNEVMIHQAL